MSPSCLAGLEWDVTSGWESVDYVNNGTKMQSDLYPEDPMELYDGTRRYAGLL